MSEALDGEAAPLRVEYVGVRNDWSYAEALAVRWLGLDDLVVIEHDIVVHAAVLSEFRSCREPWCVFPYDLSPDNPIDRGLGCARFTAEAQRLVPFTAVLATPVCEPGHWRHLDGQVAEAFESADIERHVHGPSVEHRKAA